jgi:hypothetical protein
MDKIQDILNKIYTNEQYMLYFYIVLGSIALLLILLIIITSIKVKKNNKKQVAVSNEIVNSKDETATVLPDSQILKDAKKEEVIKAEPIIETPIVNEIKPIEEPIIKEPIKEEIVKPIVTNEEPSMPSFMFNREDKEEVKFNQLDYQNDLFKEDREDDKPKFIPNMEKPTVPIFPEDIPVFKDPKPLSNDGSKSISELLQEEVKPEPLNDINFANLNESKESEEFDLPKPKAVSEVVKESPKQINPEDIKSRLANLKNLKQNNNSELDDIMKSVGLDDTKSMVALNSEENKILGR